MRYLALACDYDGTLAYRGHVADETVAALRRLVASGRKLILVTGRKLEDVLTVFSHCDVFEWVIAENGCIIYRPASRQQKRLADPPPPNFIAELRRRKIAPLSIGHAIVATWHPHESTVLEVIRELGLELQVIFNKGAVMVLPAGTNKATGLSAALRESGLSPHNVAGIGDAENDHAFLSLCECSVAVANALPTVKVRADFVTQRDHGSGVIELIDEIVASDLKEREPLLTRHYLMLGTRDRGEEIGISPYGLNLLLAGSSAGGKSTTATSILERFTERHYQFCVIDPEGDYKAVEGPIVLGNHNRPPTVDEAIRLTRNPQENAIINLVGLPLSDRPSFFVTLLPRLQELRAQTGRPHFIIVDKAHHVLPATGEPASLTLPRALAGMIYITVEPKSIARAVLSSINTVITLGDAAGRMLADVSAKLDLKPPVPGPTTLEPGEVLIWFRQKESPPFKLKIVPGRTERRRDRIDWIF